VSYTVRFTATARRALNDLPPRLLSVVIEFAFGDLSREPRLLGKPLRRELAGMYRSHPMGYHQALRRAAFKWCTTQVEIRHRRRNMFGAMRFRKIPVRYHRAEPWAFSLNLGQSGQSQGLTTSMPAPSK
jgi:mRNA interferase RelE/StbE